MRCRGFMGAHSPASRSVRDHATAWRFLSTRVHRHRRRLGDGEALSQPLTLRAAASPLGARYGEYPAGVESVVGHRGPGCVGTTGSVHAAAGVGAGGGEEEPGDEGGRSAESGNGPEDELLVEL